jgi:hypothetical protein
MLDIDDTLDIVARPSTAVAVQCPLRRALLSVHPCLRRLYQVGAALHRGGHEAGAQAVAGKGRSLEPELGGGSLDDGRDIAGGEAAIRDALRARVEDTPEDSALGDPGSLQPRSQRRYRACNLAAWDSETPCTASAKSR